MYSRHRVAGYSIDHVIKFLFFLLVPVVILDIMISCFVIFSMRSQSIQSLQDTTSLYASQIDTAHISIKKDIRFFYIIQRMNGCIVLQKFFRHLLRISSYC